MLIKINYKILSIILIFISFLSLPAGFYLEENSAGAGSYTGDITNIWSNLQIFLTNDIITSIHHQDYYSSRTPLVYIFHKIFNPFTESIPSYRTSVFIISLSVPLLFYFSLKQKFSNKDNLLLILISSMVCLSPYYRTSGFWGLEENFGLIFLLLAFLSLNSFLENDVHNEKKEHFKLVATTFLSSCCLYFDQKLIIIPLICFLLIVRSDRPLKIKLFSVFYYFIFSLPYIYLILSWRSLIPSTLLDPVYGRKLGAEIFFIHIGYASTMIAFYLFPLILFKDKNFSELIKNFLSKRINYYLIFLFFIYIIYLISFVDFNNHPFLGKGIIHKISQLLFNEGFLKVIFVYISFFISWIIILIYVENKLVDILTVVYLLVLSLFLYPIFQEYFDPLILLMAFTFFNTKLKINYKNSTILYIYLFLLLIGSNIYYENLLT